MTAIIDTCVVIDALHKRAPFDKEAQEVFLASADQRITGVLTAKSVTDVFYVLHRIFHSDIEARGHVRKLFGLFKIADTYAIDCQLALGSETKDYEDAVMIETAKRIGADCIVTRNLKDYSKSDIPIYSPTEFLKLISLPE